MRAVTPEGHGPHRYFFTVFAVKQDACRSTPIPPQPYGFQLNCNTIEKATLTGNFAR